MIELYAYGSIFMLAVIIVLNQIMLNDTMEHRDD